MLRAQCWVTVVVNHAVIAAVSWGSYAPLRKATEVSVICVHPCWAFSSSGFMGFMIQRKKLHTKSSKRVLFPFSFGNYSGACYHADSTGIKAKRLRLRQNSSSSGSTQYSTRESLQYSYFFVLTVDHCFPNICINLNQSTLSARSLFKHYLVILFCKLFQQIESSFQY